MKKMFGPFGNRLIKIESGSDTQHNRDAIRKGAEVPKSPSTQQQRYGVSSNPKNPVSTPHNYEATRKGAEVPISPSTQQFRSSVSLKSQNPVSTPHNYEASLKGAEAPISPSTQQLRSSVSLPKNSVSTPHNYEAILKGADVPFSPSTQQLRSGVFLKPKNQIKYWVDENNINCFMLFPRNLSITWSDDPNYWAWFPNKESHETAVEAAELKNVCWLDITGKFDTRNLTPGITYEVVFKVKLEDPAYGWDTPVNVKLVLPNGNYKPQEQKVSLREKSRYQWVDIRVGEFKPENNSSGEISFSMYEHAAGVWKKGLFLKGVEIRPKYRN